MPTQVPARCVIYVRVSTKEQVSNLSLDTQLERCRAYASANDWLFDEVFVEEGESAKTTDRTQLARMRAYLKAQRGRVGYVVVYALSRLARNAHDHLGLRMEFARLGVLLRSVTEPIDEGPSGKLMELLLAGFAQHHNDVLSERVTAGMKAAIERGRWPYPAITGYHNARDEAGRPTYTVDADRAPLVHEAFELAASGTPIADILAHVTARGLTTRKGGRLTYKTLGEILRNPIYSGVLRVAAWQLEVPAAFPPIVDGATFRAVQARLQGKNAPYTAQQRQNPDFPLKGFVRHACGRPLVGYFAAGRSARYGYYDCQPCRERARREAVEAAFVTTLDEAARPVAEGLALLRKALLNGWVERERTAAEEAGGLMRRASTLRERKARLAGLLLDQAVDRETYDRLLGELQADLDGVQALLDRAQADRLDAAGLIDFAVDVMSAAGAKWATATADRRRALQEFAYPQGVTWDKTNGFHRTAVTGSEVLDLDGFDGPDSRLVDRGSVRLNRFLVAVHRLRTIWLRAA